MTAAGDDAITDLDASALSQAIHGKRFSCREVMQAYLARIDRLNPKANAIVSLADGGRLLAEAERCDGELARGRSRGWLHGVPVAIKDAAMAAGFPTTAGSRLLRHAVATDDGLMTARLKAAGAVVIGKTNMPELGLGSHTFNELFGATPNPWDAAVSVGGSSGGAAAALALRLLPVADGSDFMGSLRNPAAWTNVFGLRPSIGRVPAWPAADTWVSPIGTEGPMARSVRDLTRLLSTMSGFDARVPLSNPAGPTAPEIAPASLRGLRIGWLGDLRGRLAMEAGLIETCQGALTRLAAAGAKVEPISLGFDPERLWQAWLIWRRALVAPRVALLLAGHPDAREYVKAEALWEHDQAQGLPFAEFMKASEVRSAFRAHVAGLFSHGDLLALPVTQVWPFPLGERWPESIAGRAMDTYHRWMEVTLYASFAGLPAISVPAGFHANGRWPCGLQLIGPPNSDETLLAAAAAYEALVPELLARRPAAG